MIEQIRMIFFMIGATAFFAWFGWASVFPMLYLGKIHEFMMKARGLTNLERTKEWEVTTKIAGIVVLMIAFLFFILTIFVIISP